MPWVENPRHLHLCLVDSKGFEPSTSRMRTERSPNWATSPYFCCFSQLFYQLGFFAWSFDFCIALRTTRPPNWATSPYFAVFRNFFDNLDFSLGAVIFALLCGPLALPTELRAHIFATFLTTWTFRLELWFLHCFADHSPSQLSYTSRVQDWSEWKFTFKISKFWGSRIFSFGSLRRLVNTRFFNQISFLTFISGTPYQIQTPDNSGSNTRPFLPQ